MPWRERFERRRVVWLTLGLSVVALFTLVCVAQPFFLILVPSALATFYVVAYDLVRPYPRAGPSDVVRAWTWRLLATGPLLVAAGWVVAAAVKPGGGLSFGSAADEGQFIALAVAMITPAAVALTACIVAILRRRATRSNRLFLLAVFLVFLVFGLLVSGLGWMTGTGPQTSAAMGLLVLQGTGAAAVLVSVLRLYRPKGAPRPFRKDLPLDPWGQLRGA
jgi:hypothetical protein